MKAFTARFLVEAASDAKKSALAAKYGLTLDMMEQIDKADPTHSEYTEWLAREVSRNGEDLLSDITDKLAEFVKVKRNPNWPGDKNILSYNLAAFNELAETLSREDYGKKQKVRDVEENAKKYISEGVKYLGKVNGCYVFHPLTAVASMAMSEGTHWCTKGESTSVSYLTDGDIYVVTKDGYTNDYHNDKYIQIFVSRDRIEIETAEGKDLSSNDHRGRIYTEEAMQLLNFLGTVDPHIKEDIENGEIVLSDDHVTCYDCGGALDEDDARTDTDGDTYCEDCYFENFAICDYCGDEINTNTESYFGDNDGTYCSDCGQHCSGCDQGYCIKGRRAVSFHDIKGGDPVCDSCFSDNYFGCYECDEGLPITESVEFDDEYYCQECFAAKWEEDVGETIEKWIAEEHLTNVITEAVKGQAENEFTKRKQELVGDVFKDMQREGYLFSWDDLDLATAIGFIPADKLKEDPLKAMVYAISSPVDFAIDLLTEEMMANDHPTESWDVGEVLESLAGLGVIDEDEKYVPEFSYFI